jgi:hypothetical protein
LGCVASAVMKNKLRQKNAAIPDFTTAFYRAVISYRKCVQHIVLDD